ncbi:MAG: hypothetical protein LUG95_02790, partial [Clostridiales bacterium]|nr:hypothetical protein [Clostridiales bacterium]
SIIYKFIRKNSGWKYTVEDLYFALEQKVTYGQLCYALDAFEETGLIRRNDGIELMKIDGKADLENTAVLKTLKGRLLN